MTIEEITLLYDETLRAVWGDRMGADPPTSDYATDASIEADELALSIRFPASVRYFMQYSNFGYPLVGPGDPRRQTITWLNDYYRNNFDWVMPQELVMFSGGHDGDCDCFDTRTTDADGEYPIVYWDLESMKRIEEAVPVASTFPEYLVKRIEWLMTNIR